MKKEKITDQATLIETIAVLLFTAIPMMAFPKTGEDVITGINSAISDSISLIYSSVGLAIFCFVMYIAFGKYGNVTLDKVSDKPELNTFTWAVVPFCTSIGSDILYWGVIEWAFYYQVPPNGVKSTGDEAFQYTTQYGMFRRGLVAWAIYVLLALPIGYLVFVRKQPVYKISQACRPILEGQTDKFAGKVVDILFIFGLLGGTATLLALDMSLISTDIEGLTGLDGKNMILHLAILLIITIIFAISSYTGLKKGI